MTTTRKTFAAIAATAALALPLAGCSPSIAPEPIATSSTTIAPSKSPSIGAIDASPVKPFGTTVTTDSGATIALSAPKAFTPSPTATHQGAASAFEVTMKNGTDAPLDINGAFVSALRDGQVSEGIFDSEKEIMGAPMTALRPGKSATWTVVFVGSPEGSWDVDVMNAGDVAMFSTEATR